MIIDIALLIAFLVRLCSAASTASSSGTERITFGNGISLTRDGLKEIFLKRSTSYPDNFDPFSYSLMNSFVGDNPVTAPFFKFLFNNTTEMFEFDPANKGSWEAHLTLNLTQFKSVNLAEYREILCNVIEPGYNFIRPENIPTILKSDDDDEYLLNVLERESFNNFVTEYNKIIQSSSSDEEQKRDLNALLLMARREAGFRSKQGKYHFAFLIQVPFEILKGLKPEGNDFDDFFAAMSQAAYNRMTQNSESSDEALLIMSSILPSVYDQIPDSLSYSEVIQAFVDSETTTSSKIRTSENVIEIIEFINSKCTKKEGYDFLLEFIGSYLPDKMKFLLKSIDSRPYSLFVAIKRMERIYPNFVADHYEETMKECAKMIQDNRKQFMASTLIDSTIPRYGFVEILDVSPFNYTVPWTPKRAINYSLRKFFKKSGRLCNQQDKFVDIFAHFVSRKQLKASDFCCRKAKSNKVIALALIKSFELGSFDFFLAKDYAMNLEVIEELFIENSKPELYEKLLNHSIKYHRTNNITMSEYHKHLILKSLREAHQFELLQRIINGDFEFNENLLKTFTKEILNDSVYQKRFDLIKPIFHRFGSSQTGIDQLLYNAIHKENQQVTQRFLESCHEIFQDTETMKLFASSAVNHRSESVLYFLRRHCKSEIFNFAILQVRQGVDFNALMFLNNITNL